VCILPFCRPRASNTGAPDTCARRTPLLAGEVPARSQPAQGQWWDRQRDYAGGADQLKRKKQK